MPAPTASNVAKEAERLKRKLLMWDVMPKADREALGEPPTLSEWGRVNGKSERTLSNWRAEEWYGAEKERLLEARAKAAAADVDPGRAVRVIGERAVAAIDAPPIEVDPSLSNTDRMRNIIRSQLMLAEQGDAKALDFVRAANISKPILDQLSHEAEAGHFADESDEQVCDRIIDSFGDLLVARLRARNLV